MLEVTNIDFFAQKSSLPTYPMVFCFWFRHYVPVNNFSVILEWISWISPSLSNGDEVSSSRTLNHARMRIEPATKKMVSGAPLLTHGLKGPDSLG